LAILIPSSRFRYVSRLAAGKVYLTLLLVRTQLDAESNATFSNGICGEEKPAQVGRSGGRPPNFLPIDLQWALGLGGSFRLRPA
jgi:hypothetical protein